MPKVAKVARIIYISAAVRKKGGQALEWVVYAAISYIVE